MGPDLRRKGHRAEEDGEEEDRKEDEDQGWREVECRQGISARKRYKKILRKALRDLRGAEAAAICSLSEVYWVLSVHQAGR